MHLNSYVIACSGTVYYDSDLRMCIHPHHLFYYGQEQGLAQDRDQMKLGFKVLL